MGTNDGDSPSVSGMFCSTIHRINAFLKLAFVEDVVVVNDDIVSRVWFDTADGLLSNSCFIFKHS